MRLTLNASLLSIEAARISVICVIPLTPSAGRAVKITSVKTFHVQCRLSKKAGGSGYMEDSRSAVLVKISTDEGLVGWGETVALGGGRRLIEEQFTPLLIGRDPVRDQRKLWPELWGRYFHSGPAVSAIDMALDDLRGKAFDAPIGDLYGGRLRDRVAVYASGMN